MNDSPKVSIVIPFYNCAYVHQAIESALAQSYPNLEVIVVNDGATRYADNVRPYLNRIMYLVKPNGGTGSALNMGIRHATGQYFAWLSSDDLFAEDKVQKQIEFMLKQNAAASYSSYYQIDAKDKLISPVMGVGYPDKLHFYRMMQRGCFINGCTVMLRMDVFRQVGLFNESLKYTQDYEMWLRILQHYEFAYLQDPLVAYRVHEEMGTLKHQPLIMREINVVRQSYRNKKIQAVNR